MVTELFSFRFFSHHIKDILKLHKCMFYICLKINKFVHFWIKLVHSNFLYNPRLNCPYLLLPNCCCLLLILSYYLTGSRFTGFTETVIEMTACPLGIHNLRIPQVNDLLLKRAYTLTQKGNDETM